MTGATGFIGRPLCSELVRYGYEVIALTRRSVAPEGVFHERVKFVRWDAATSDGWAELADGAVAIINLAGENIGAGRWTQKKKKRILQSRLNAGNAITKAIRNARQKPQVLIQASGIGYYGDRDDELLDETASNGTGFLADVAKQWEHSVHEVQILGVRRVTIRLGIVLGSAGGVVARLIPPFRFFLGGHPGSGKQWLGWVHIEDGTRIIRFLVENTDCQGPFNVTAPEPILSRDFYNIFGRIMHRPALFPMPAFALKLILGEMATALLLPSLRVTPKKLLEKGYRFKYPDLTDALKEILL